MDAIGFFSREDPTRAYDRVRCVPVIQTDKQKYFTIVSPDMKESSVCISLPPLTTMGYCSKFGGKAEICVTLPPKSQARHLIRFAYIDTLKRMRDLYPSVADEFTNPIKNDLLRCKVQNTTKCYDKSGREMNPSHITYRMKVSVTVEMTGFNLTKRSGVFFKLLSVRVH